MKKTVLYFTFLRKSVEDQCVVMFDESDKNIKHRLSQKIKETPA